ncbi:hypothetical protein MG293_012377 [Ovis ammon polii]|uniref:G-protein coupled receptors family 1 profile domain-containing protein n=1 Tax=Ovis ammon polii TaxID=230172 RepID=A0AAD4U473_OVIAM|nr:hypothetical protein MG293_012377 [Ovis ammon polii]
MIIKFGIPFTNASMDIYGKTKNSLENKGIGNEDENHIKSQNCKTYEKTTCVIDTDVFCSQLDHSHVLTVGVGNYSGMEKLSTSVITDETFYWKQRDKVIHRSLRAHNIAFDACLTQMFFIRSFTALESGFFLSMAIDRYVAICHPLRHTTILTHTRITIMGIIVVIWGVAFFSLHPVLLKQLPYCRTRIIVHTYGEFMAV